MLYCALCGVNVHTRPDTLHTTSVVYRSVIILSFTLAFFWNVSECHFHVVCAYLLAVIQFRLGFTTLPFES